MYSSCGLATELSLRELITWVNFVRKRVVERFGLRQRRSFVHEVQGSTSVIN